MATANSKPLAPRMNSLAKVLASEFFADEAGGNRFVELGTKIVVLLCILAAMAGLLCVAMMMVMRRSLDRITPLGFISTAITLGLILFCIGAWTRSRQRDRPLLDDRPGADPGAAFAGGDRGPLFLAAGDPAGRAAMAGCLITSLMSLADMAGDIIDSILHPENWAEKKVPTGSAAAILVLVGRESMGLERDCDWRQAIGALRVPLPGLPERRELTDLVKVLVRKGLLTEKPHLDSQGRHSERVILTEAARKLLNRFELLESKPASP